MNVKIVQKAELQTPGSIPVWKRPSLTPSVTKGLDWPSQTPPSQALWSQKSFTVIVARGVETVERAWKRTRRRRAPTTGQGERGSAHTRGAMRQNGPAAAGLGQQRGRQQKVRHARAACARTNAKGADARSAGARASASTSAKGADARSAGVPAPAPKEPMQGALPRGG